MLTVYDIGPEQWQVVDGRFVLTRWLRGEMYAVWLDLGQLAGDFPSEDEIGELRSEMGCEVARAKVLWKSELRNRSDWLKGREGAGA